MDPQIQPVPKSKLQSIHEYLLSKPDVEIPKDYTEFESTLSGDPAHLEGIYNYLKEDPDVEVTQKDLKEFQAAVLPPKKKAEPFATTLQPPGGMVDFGKSGATRATSSPDANGAPSTDPAKQLGDLSDPASLIKSVTSLDRQVDNPGKDEKDFHDILDNELKPGADMTRLRQGLGIDKRPKSIEQRVGNIAGRFNRPFIQLAALIPKLTGMVRKGVDEMLYGQSKPVQAYDAYKLGTWIEEKGNEYVAQIDPELNGFWESDIPSALGSAMSLILTGGGSGGSKLIGEKMLLKATEGGVIKPALHELGTMLVSRPALTGGGLMGVSEFEAAKRTGLTDREAIQVFMKNAMVGTTEAIPLQRMLHSINDFSGKTLTRIIKAGFKGSMEEGTQEAIQQYFTNKIAQGSYDPTREPWQDLINSIGAGMFVGFVLPGIMQAGRKMTPEQREKTMSEILSALGKPQVPFADTKAGAKAQNAAFGFQQDIEQPVNAPEGDLGKKPEPQQNESTQNAGPVAQGGQDIQVEPTQGDGIDQPAASVVQSANAGGVVDTGQAAPEEQAPSLEALVDQMDNNEKFTIDDLATQVENIAEDHPMAAELQNAVEKWKAAKEEDFEKLGGRGDSDAYNEEFENTVRSIVEKSKPVASSAIDADGVYTDDGPMDPAKMDGAQPVVFETRDDGVVFGRIIKDNGDTVEIQKLHNGQIAEVPKDAVYDALKTKAGNYPNIHGVYISDDIEKLVLPGKKAIPAAEIELVELEDGRWISTSSYHNKARNSGSPLTAHNENIFDSREDALNDAAENIRKSNKSEKNTIKWLDKISPRRPGAEFIGEHTKTPVPQKVEDLKVVEAPPNTTYFRADSPGTRTAVKSLGYRALSEQDARNGIEDVIYGQLPSGEIREFAPFSTFSDLTSDEINEQWGENAYKDSGNALAESRRKPSLKTAPKGKLAKNKKVQFNVNKEVSASKSVAIEEVATRFKLKPMEASMLYNLRVKDIYHDDYYGTATLRNQKAYDPPIGLKGQIFNKLRDANFVEEKYIQGQGTGSLEYELTDKAKEFIKLVDARAQTRQQVKAGQDLFPDQANIPEYVSKSANEPEPIKPVADVEPSTDSTIWPEGHETVKADLNPSPVVSQEKANKTVKSWKDQAKAQGKDKRNAKKVVISLFDYTGSWSKPFVEAGHPVFRIDIQHGDYYFEVEHYAKALKKMAKESLLAMDVGIDLIKHGPISMQNLKQALQDAGYEVHAVLSATPCTTFSGSGAHAWPKHDAFDSKEVEKRYGEWAAAHFESPTEYNLFLVKLTEEWMAQFEPKVSAMENPIGRIAKVAELPNPTMIFQPNLYGDPYTKRTQLWGKFNSDLPQAHVEATEGSKMQSKLSSKDKVQRSATPEGFSYSFFIANQAEHGQSTEPTDGRKSAGSIPDEVQGSAPDNQTTQQDAPPVVPDQPASSGPVEPVHQGSGGQAVRLSTGTAASFDWLGTTQDGIIVSFDEESGKYLIRSTDGTNYKIRPSDIKPSATPKTAPSTKKSLEAITANVDKMVGRAKKKAEDTSKQDPGVVAASINPFYIMKQVWMGLNKAQRSLFAPWVKRGEDAVAAVVNSGLKHEAYALRNTAGTLQNLIGGLGYTHGDLANKLNWMGSKNYGNLKAKLFQDDLYSMVASDPTSIELVHRALDPETWLKYTHEGQVASDERDHWEQERTTAKAAVTNFIRESPKDVNGEPVDPKEVTRLKDIVKQTQDKVDTAENELNRLATKLGNDTLAQLSQAERNMYDIIRDTNDFMHNWYHEQGLIDDATYEAHKGTYIARLYEEFELTPPDVEQVANSVRPDFNIFKKRSDFEKVQKNLLRDPVYATAKRLSQMLQTEAMFEYMDQVSQSKTIQTSDTEFPNSTQMGAPGSKPYYGKLTGKYIPNYIAQDVKGFFFANTMMNHTYAAFRGYDRLWVRQFLKKLHTIYNPLVQLGNKMANYSFAIWSGVDPYTFTVNKFKVSKEIKNHGPYFQDLMQAGILGTDIVTTDLIPSKQAGAKDKNILEKASDKASEYYGRADDEAKLATYIALREDYKYSKEKAIGIIYESFQNYATVGKLFDFASKTPIIGNPYIKFKADLMRIMKNGVTRQPLTMAAWLWMINVIGGLLSDVSDEDEVVKEIRERRPFIPKIWTPFGEIPMVWQTPIGEVNFARYLSPFYVYDKGDKDDMLNDITDWLPYQFEMRQISPSKDISVPTPEFLDVFLGTYMQVAFDKDFRGKSIADPQGNKFLTRESNPLNQWFNRLNYIARSQVPMFGSAADMKAAYSGEADYYGRERTITQAILNNVIKIQEFEDKQAAETLAKEIRFRVAKFESLSRDISAKKTNAENNLVKIQASELTSEEKKRELSNKEIMHLLEEINIKIDEQVDLIKELEDPAILLRKLNESRAAKKE